MSCNRCSKCNVHECCKLWKRNDRCDCYRNLCYLCMLDMLQVGRKMYINCSICRRKYQFNIVENVNIMFV